MNNLRFINNDLIVFAACYLKAEPSHFGQARDRDHDCVLKFEDVPELLVAVEPDEASLNDFEFGNVRYEVVGYGLVHQNQLSHSAIPLQGANDYQNTSAPNLNNNSLNDSNFRLRAASCFVSTQQHGATVDQRVAS